MVKALERMRSMFTTKGGDARSLRQAFASQRDAALSTWREAVAAHATGKPIDIAAISVAGPLIGVEQSQVPAVFSRDVEVFKEAREHEEHANKMDAAAVAAEQAARGAAEEIEKLNMALAAAIQRRDSGVWSHVAASHSRTPLNALKRSNPRLWDDQRDVEPDRYEAALSLEVTPLPTANHADDDGAEWMPDNGKD